MEATLRYVKYALAAPVIDVVLRAFPALCRRSPPWRAINYGGVADYLSNGDSVVNSMVRLAKLKPGDRLLELGMGIAGNATALLRRFGDGVDYMGFDAVAYGVTWSRQHFARLSNRYRFDHGDIYNSFYNPRGKIQPTEYRFPYADASADLAFANSVFTHMQPPELQHYFRETARVLKPGGRVWFTFFLLDEDSEQRIKAGRARYTFQHPQGVCRVESAVEPDVAVAYPTAWIKEQLAEAGFDEMTIERSSWRGNEAPSLQDVVVAVRRLNTMDSGGVA